MFAATLSAQVNQFPQVYYNGQGSSGFNLYIHQSASLSSPNITSLSVTSKIGVETYTTSTETEGTATWAKACLPSTTGNIRYGYILYGEYYARINEINNYAVVTAVSLNIRPCAGCTSSNVTIGGQNAMFGQNSIVALTGNISSGWYEVYLTNDCSQTTGWVSGTYLTINNSTSNYKNVGGEVTNSTNVSIWGATVTIGNWTTNSTEGFYQYKLATNWSGLITCTHPGYSSSNPVSYSHTASSHNYSRNFVLSNCSGPAIPTANPATNITTTSFNANWNSVSGAIGYYVDVSTSSTFSNFVYNNTYVGNTTTYTFTSLTCNTHYYYRVRAFNSCGTSGNSSTISVWTSACCNPPNPPTAQTATYITGNSFRANWSSVSNATGYFLDVATNTSFSNLIYSNLSAGNTTSQNITGLNCNTTYYYRVRSSNNCGSSGNSNTISVTTGTCSGITITSSIIPPWQRQGDSFQGSVSVSTSNPSGAPWHLEIDVFDSGGNYLTAIIYPTITAPTQNFYSSDPQLAANSVAGRSFVFFAVLDANSAISQAGIMKIIEKRWENKNFILLNEPGQQLKIPLKYVQGATKVVVKFCRNKSFSTSLETINATQHYNQGTFPFSLTCEYCTSSNPPIYPQFCTSIDANSGYFILDIGNTNNLSTLSPGIFDFAVGYYTDSYFSPVLLCEQGTFDLTKISNPFNSRNLASNKNKIIVLAGDIGNEIGKDIDKTIQLSYYPMSKIPFSVVNTIWYEKQWNIWYISQPNLGMTQKNAYDLGIALEKILSLCMNSGSNSPEISVLAFGKSALEMRIMLAEMGAPTSNVVGFSNQYPDNAFTNTTIDGKLKSVTFIGAPHTGTNTYSIPDYKHAGFELNPSSGLIQYLNNNTQIPSSIRIANIAGYGNKGAFNNDRTGLLGILNDGVYSFATTSDVRIHNQALIRKYIIKDPRNPIQFESLIDQYSACQGLGPLNDLLNLILYGNSSPILRCLVFNDCGSNNIITCGTLGQAIIDGLSLHTLLSSSYLLRSQSASCAVGIGDACNSNTSSTYSKLISFIENNNISPNCCLPQEDILLIGLPGSILPGAEIKILSQDSNQYYINSISDENGIAALSMNDITTGDTLLLEAPQYETIKIIADSLFKTISQHYIPMMKTSLPSDKIMCPVVKTIGHYISSNQVAQFYINATNANQYEVLKQSDTAFSTLSLSNHVYTTPIDTGFNYLVFRMTNEFDTLIISKIIYLPDETTNLFNQTIMIDNSSSLAKLYLNNVSSIDIFSGLNELLLPNEGFSTLHFTKLGFQDTTLYVSSNTGLINISLQPLNSSYYFYDSTIFNFPLNGKIQYHKNVTVVDSACSSVISMRQFNDNFTGTGLIPKSRKFEMHHLNSNWSEIRFAAVLNQVENLSEDSIYLLRIINDFDFTKISFDTNGSLVGYDSIVQKLNYNHFDFNNGTAFKEAIIIMKKQAPIVNIVNAFTMAQSATLKLPLTNFFSDPDSIQNDMNFQLGNSSSQLSLQIIGDSLFITPVSCWNGNGIFTLQAQHDGLWRSVTCSVNVIASPLPTITANGSTTLCQGNSVTLTASQGNSYLWSNGSTQPSITVTTGGVYTVAVTDQYNCTATSLPITITLFPLPNSTITITGPTSFCEGNYVILSAPSSASYLWNDGSITQSISASITGNYFVTVTDYNNCSATSSSVSVVVNPNPEPLVNANGATTFCYGDSVTLTCSISGANYLWNTNETTQSIAVSFSGNYFVEVTDSYGCSGTSEAITITVNSLPTVDAGSTVTITQGNSTVIGGFPTAIGYDPFIFLWNPETGLDSTNVANPTASPQITTRYTVMVTDANGCTNIDSVLVNVDLPIGIPESKKGPGLLVYPNPANDKLYVAGSNVENGEYNFELKNAIGQTMFVEKARVLNNLLQIQFSISDFEAGMYFLIIETSKIRSVTKVQKLER